MKKINRPLFTAQNISEDDLWYVAGIDVQGEREGWANIPEKEYLDYKEVMSILRDNAELELQYNGILECQFENYDSEH